MLVKPSEKMLLIFYPLERDDIKSLLNLLVVVFRDRFLCLTTALAVLELCRSVRPEPSLPASSARSAIVQHCRLAETLL